MQMGASVHQVPSFAHEYLYMFFAGQKKGVIDFPNPRYSKLHYLCYQNLTLTILASVCLFACHDDSSLCTL